MKTAVSIPDALFAEAEDLAKRTKKSRSQLFADALREYVARHSPDEITDAMNHAIGQIAEDRDEFVDAATRSTLERVEW